MPRLTPGDVFDNPIATEGYVSSDWGLPGEDPDQSYPQDTGYPGEIAGPNYLLEEAQAGVYDEAGSHLFDFTGAYGGGYDSFGADPTVCDPRIQSCPPGAPTPGQMPAFNPGMLTELYSSGQSPYGPALPPGYETVVSYAAVPPPTTTLRQGMRGAQVLNWQKYLTSQGFAVSQDSSFGPATARATREFQSSRGLQTDGVVGPATRDAMTQPAVPTSQRTTIQTPSQSYSTPSTPAPYTPPLPTDGKELFTTRNIAIGLIGLSVLGTVAVVAFGGKE